MMNRLGRLVTVGGAWSAMLFTLGLSASACLSRPVGKEPPTTKVNFTSTVSQQAVDKVDLLFAIDNSQSMGDKQDILAQAVPNLIEGLLKPRCVDTNGNPTGGFADPARSKAENYGCAQGEPEFKPVIDMHIGIVSSSLGNFGGDVCAASNARTNDRANLIDYSFTSKGSKVPQSQPSGFLSWFPQAEENENTVRHPPPANPIRLIADLNAAFQDMVKGVEQNGCGLEAQLESVYRFLNQPDPWDTIRLAGNKFADLGDSVDDKVLLQRKEFLRPDSLVAVIMLTDEDDSSADPLALGGQGWAFMAKSFPGSEIQRNKGGTTAPRGTKICETDPASPDCRSCGFAAGCDGQDWCAKLRADPNCREPGALPAGPGRDGFYPKDDDELNVRFHRMKQRFGIDPQYPLQRYIDGFTKFRVPDRSTEHIIQVSGESRQISDYSGAPKCTNPLFAAELPSDSSGTPEEREAKLCNLRRGTRSPDLVFFAVVGGVPNELLYPNGYNPNDAEANRTTPERWNKIIGRDPINYDYTGIDPHMIQSVSPRPGLTGADQPRGSNGTDWHGREWNTQKSDLQYACTFPLNVKRPCVAGDQSCDCAPDSTANPPLCGTGAEVNTQIRAKAYPTIREFSVVRALGDQGIAASLCPIQLTAPEAPDYGYKPAVAAIIDRLKNALTTQCLPQKLFPNEETNEAPCLVLAQLPEGNKCETYDLKRPDQAILDVFREQQKAESGNTSVEGAVDLSNLDVCQLPQVSTPRGETCRDNQSRVWCYVENGGGKQPAGRCPQALIFSAGTADLSGARFSLQCIQNLKAGEASGDTQR